MLAWETLRGPAAAVGMFRSWIDIAPDAEVRFETLAGDGEHIAVRFGGYGHAADGGGAMEYVVIGPVTVRDGRELRAELFDPEDEAPRWPASKS